MNSYESMLVLKPELTEEECLKLNNAIKEHIVSLDGEIVETVVWGKRQLAYEIDKKKEGFYILNYMTLGAEQMKPLEQYFKLNENIIRYNLLRINKN